ncbi:MAG: serine hydrolase domain-containing protein [Bacteroidota bacterium]
MKNLTIPFFYGLLTLLIILPFVGNAQKDLKPKVSIEEIDELYQKWDNLEKPGIALGIVSNGEIVHTKGYGLANLTYNIPVTPNTKFYLGKIANQFIVLGILLLEAEGKLTLDDDIRKHLPEFAHLQTPIAIADLIHHTSGLRDLAITKALGGELESKEMTVQAATQLIARQRQLNNQPSKAFEPNHSGFLLLEKIIAKVSEVAYTDFIQQNILAPLQMTQTVFDDASGKIIKNKAIGYYPNADSYREGSMKPLAMNSTNVYSTVKDICKWEQNFLSATPKVGTVAMFKKMDTPVIVDGVPMPIQNYAMSFGQLQYWDYNGTRKMFNVSMAGGFACKSIRYPEYNLSLIVMGNDGVYNGSTATATSELYVKNYFSRAPGPRKLVEVEGISLPTESLEKFTGDYWEDSGFSKRSIYLQNDTLWYARSNGYNSPIIPISKNRFQMITYVNLFVEFVQRGDQKMMLVEVEGDQTYEYVGYDSEADWTKDLSAYTGQFYCKELNTSYQFMLNNQQLVAKHPNKGTIEFNPILEHSFVGNQPHFNKVTFQVGKEGAIDGMYIFTDSGDQIWFEKVPTASSRRIN